MYQRAATTNRTSFHNTEISETGWLEISFHTLEKPATCQCSANICREFSLTTAYCIIYGMPLY